MVLYDLDKPVLCETYLQKALSLCQDVGDRDMTPFVWALLGHTAVLQGNLDDAIVCASEAVNILKAVGNVLLSSATLSYIIVGELFWQLGDYRQAEKCYQSAIAKVKNQDLTMESKISLCCIAMSQGDNSKARYLLDDLRQSIRGKEHSWNYTFLVRVYAELEWGMGNFSQAGIWLNELQKVIKASNYQRYNNFHKTSAELGFAKVALSKSDWEAAAEHIQCALNIQMEMPIYYRHLFEDKYAAVYLAAVFSLSLDKPDKAARLLGAANNSFQIYRLTFPLSRRQLIDQTIEDSRAALDGETFTTAWEEGKAMDLNEALAYALQVVEQIQTSI
jgi:tetratricopeptide (TPR) repeat protein